MKINYKYVVFSYNGSKSQGKLQNKEIIENEPRYERKLTTQNIVC